MPPVTEVSRFLAVLALVAGGGAVLLVVLRRHPATAALRARATAAAALVATTSTAGSLFYSEVAGYVPCELCWYQRIAMYPLAVVLGLAALRGDDAIRPYARTVAVLGLAISLWHVAVQRLPALAGAGGCSATSPCTAVWVDVLGGLTIPTMAACGFLAIAALTSVPTSPTSREG